ncbi:MAG: UDP-4-amino-4,6-dideoxy-N-acetyl-beta-L-altrosamine transaminase [Hyphomicrobiaceae bacterium]|nr:UDP-4-amino-4,6-dideoxy-N-acetyl-beta-L-altrosamine transaminase [Hyphomicrobiaceae bacterium]
MLPYGKQSIDQSDIDEVIRVLRSDYLTTGPEIELLEQAFCQATGARHAVACANGTAALHLIAMAMNLQPGDEVVVPSISFVATANGARYCGADVVFADVDPETSLMTPATLEAALKRVTPGKLKAIFAVHMGGHPADMPALKAIADREGVFMVEDACHALGTTYTTADGREHRIGDGAHSDFAALSLHPVKTITCGEGGIVFTPHDHFAHDLKIKRSHGLSRDADEWTNGELAFEEGTGAANPWYYELGEVGYNYRLTDFQAAMARSQLKRLPHFAARRRRLVALYHQKLDGLSNVVKLVAPRDGTDPVLHLMVALIDFKAIGKTRKEVMMALRQRGVGTQVHYIPIHRQPYYARRAVGLDLPGADAYYAKCLSLPLYPDMTDADVDVVVGALREIAG